MKKFLVQSVLKLTFFALLFSVARRCLTNVFLQKQRSISPEAVSDDIRQIVTNFGYTFEAHQVITQDGYILEIHRLQSSSTPSSPTGVVFFMHGCLQSSLGWLTAGLQNSLPYQLADRGYDVWLGNARGNKYARRHQRIDPDEDQGDFFDFSMHEIGYYDMPSSIDYVLNATTSSRLHCVTHSQGSAALYIMLSERPEYNAKIRSSIVIAPALIITHSYAIPLRLISWAPRFSEMWLNILGFYELFPYSDVTAMLAQKYCSDGSMFQPVCEFILGVPCGFNSQELNKTLLSALFTYGPAGGSVKQFYHYAQIKVNGKFQKYDYGPTKNIQLYNQTEPIEYNLSNNQIPTAMFYSDNDWTTHEEDFKELAKRLPNIKYLHKETGFAHLDYLIGKSTQRLFKIMHEFIDNN